MNCKAGDLVRYVGRNPLNRPNIYGWVGVAISYIRDGENQPCWTVEPPVPGGRILCEHLFSDDQLVSDCALSPIRDNPGQDETLIYAGLPGERVTA